MSKLKEANHVDLVTLEEIQDLGFPKARNIIISCLAPSEPHNYIFGDYLPLDVRLTGPYPTEIFEKIKQLATDDEKFFILIFPQRHPVSEIWHHKNILYIELPEFYGVYWDFFQYHQPDLD
jgi:hypothetical protein